MIKMKKTMRDKIVEFAAENGWVCRVGKDGRDLYDKLITLERGRAPWRIFIDKCTGFTKAGDLKNFKVAVNPQFYDSKLCDLRAGITPYLNQLSKENLHCHSGYLDCPEIKGYGEPCAKAYRVDSLDALKTLLAGW